MKMLWQDDEDFAMFETRLISLTWSLHYYWVTFLRGWHLMEDIRTYILVALSIENVELLHGWSVFYAQCSTLKPPCHEVDPKLSLSLSYVKKAVDPKLLILFKKNTLRWPVPAMCSGHLVFTLARTTGVPAQCVHARSYRCQHNAQCSLIPRRNTNYFPEKRSIYSL